MKKHTHPEQTWLNRPGNDTNRCPEDNIEIDDFSLPISPDFDEIDMDYRPPPKALDFVEVIDEFPAPPDTKPRSDEELNIWSGKKPPPYKPSLELPKKYRQQLDNEKKQALTKLKERLSEALQLMVMETQTVFNYDGNIWRLIDKDNFVVIARTLIDGEEFADSISDTQLEEIYNSIRRSPKLQITSAEITRRKKSAELMIQCKNGVYYPLRMQRGESKPENYNSSSLDISVHDILPTPAPLFDRYCESAFNGEKDIIDRAMEMLGCIIAGYQFKGLVVLIGESHTGKSVFMNLCRMLIGEDNCTSLNSLNDLKKPDAVADFIGKRLCTIGDHPDVKISEEASGQVKALTGGDAVRGRQLYKAAVIFVNEALIVISTNHQLRFEALDGGLKNRIIELPFLRVIPADEDIPHFEELLSGEIGGIIYKACRALRRFADSNRFTEIDDSYFDAMNLESGQLIDKFFHDDCERGDTFHSATSDLYAAFVNRCHGSPPYNQSVFGRELSQQFGLESWRSNSQRGFKGIRLKTSYEQSNLS